ncbi:MAG: FHA domain-containing protein [Phycisphaerales bacterium]|nr:FHA domain-containing protein [Phycisphaerales bacterium]
MEAEGDMDVEAPDRDQARRRHQPPDRPAGAGNFGPDLRQIDGHPRLPSGSVRPSPGRRGRCLWGKDRAPVEVALVHVRSDGKQQSVTLKGGRLVFGRQDDCQIRIPSAQISRHHCEVVSGASGVRIRDLGSSNGTYVNGRKVEDAELDAGDVIAIGSLLFVVRIDGNPATIDPEQLSQRVRSASSAAAAPTAATVGEGTASDDSSVDFDFDFSDEDEDDQPAL